MSYIPKDCQSKTSLTHPMHSFGLCAKGEKIVYGPVPYTIYNIHQHTMGHYPSVDPL